MFMRPDLNTTIGDLDTIVRERDSEVDEVRVSPDQIEFHLSATDPVIKVGDLEAPATETGLQAFGDLLQVPTAFLKRANKNVRSETMDAFLGELLRNSLTKDAKVKIKGQYIQGVEEWGNRANIQPHHLTGIGAKVLGTDCPVVRVIDEPSFFGYDVHVPEDRAHVGGEILDDKEDRRVNDVTAGGIRVGVNLKQGLAPTVEEFLYRLWCTNGMTMQDMGLKVDARGQSVDEVLAELESLAELAFSRVENSVKAFYDLKSQRVNNVERAIRAIARERNIPTRSTMALLDLAASDEIPDEPSMFDVVNLVTNFANSPTINRDGGRLLLEGAGGAVISDHASRCSHCQQKVGG